MRKELIAISVLMLGAATVQAGAHGAIAIGGNTADVAKNGIAVGDSYNYDTKGEAETRALQECLTPGSAPSETKALCKIVADFSNEWVAIAMDPESGTPGFGWSIDANKATADRNALAQCRASSPDERKQYCVISRSDHDEKP